MKASSTFGASLLPSQMFGLTAGTLGYSLALSALVCACTNAVGFVITTVTKTHKITDLVVRFLIPLRCMRALV